MNGWGDIRSATETGRARAVLYAIHRHSGYCAIDEVIEYAVEKMGWLDVVWVGGEPVARVELVSERGDGARFLVETIEGQVVWTMRRG